MSKRYRLSDRTAVITGAGSGIGRALAHSLARRGCHLALADVNASGLKQTARELSSDALIVSQHVIDVADKGAAAALRAQVEQAHPRVDVLINNAGVAVGGSFDQVTPEDFEWLFEVNFLGLVRITREFLPLLRARDEARIVNVSSVFGLVAPPGQTAYSASKFAVRGFSESLRHELEGSNVGLTVVHPGGVATQIAANARVSDKLDADEIARRRRSFQKHLRLAPGQASEVIVDAIERRMGRVLIGDDAKLLALLQRLAPVSYWKLVGRLVGTP